MDPIKKIEWPSVLRIWQEDLRLANLSCCVDIDRAWNIERNNLGV